MSYKKAYIKTFGCQMNIHDSEYLKSEISDLGYVFIGDINEANLVLFNTCSVREKPEKKIKALLSEIKGLKRKKKDLFVIVCGCTAQQLGKSLQEEHPFIDLVFGPDEVFNFRELFNKAKTEKTSSIYILFCRHKARCFK
jgi:tRNA-2-methylthio-N6-dimethylallyladenosine synthase